jgi:hypothetical protein
LFFEWAFPIILEEKNHSLSAVFWKGRLEVYVPTNFYTPPAEGNFRGKSGNPVKPLVIEDYNTHMGYVTTWPLAMVCAAHRSSHCKCSDHPLVV